MVASHKPSEQTGGRFKFFWRQDAGHRYRRSQRWQIYGAAGLLAYLFITLSTAAYMNGISTHPSKEFYPFFSWSLFSKVKNERPEYLIMIHKLDGEEFAEPIDMRKVSKQLNLKGGHRSLSYKALQNIGKTLWSEKKDAKASLSTFETQYFGGHDVDYEIVRETFRPLDRWRDAHAVVSREDLGRFEYRGRSS